MMLGMNLLNQYIEKYSMENFHENKPKLKDYSLDLSKALTPIFMNFIGYKSLIAIDYFDKRVVSVSKKVQLIKLVFLKVI